MLSSALSYTLVFASKDKEDLQHINEIKKVSSSTSVGIGGYEIHNPLVSLKHTSSLDDDIRVPSSPSISIVGSSREDNEFSYNMSLSRSKARANQLIRERISLLEANKKVIENGNSLTSEQKAGLSAVLATNISNLKLLNAQIASSNRCDKYKGIGTSYLYRF